MYYHHSQQLRDCHYFTISFVLNVAGDLPDLQAPPQPCSIKKKTDTDNIDLDDNNNNNNK